MFAGKEQATGGGADRCVRAAGLLFVGMTLGGFMFSSTNSTVLATDRLIRTTRTTQMPVAIFRLCSLKSSTIWFNGLPVQVDLSEEINCKT